MFGEGESGPRHFDFSAAPDVPGFDYASECEAQYEMGDESAYRAFLARSGLPYGRMGKKALALCVRTVRLLDCESVYYFPKSLDVCEGLTPSSGRVATAASNAESDVETAGHLVIHVRSGDVFRYRRAYGSYGQVSETYTLRYYPAIAGCRWHLVARINACPNESDGGGREGRGGKMGNGKVGGGGGGGGPPLSYYMAVLNNRPWDRVDLVTYTNDGGENPVLPALRMLAEMETWPNMELNIHTDRSIEVDVQTMLCADAFATSRSTLGELTMYHTRAKTIFLSSTCDGYGSTFGHTSGRLISARSFREEAFEVSRRHVLGVTLRPDAPLYELYETDQFTDKERLEMLQYSGLDGIEECTSSELDVDRWDSVSSSRSPLGNMPR
eukprot:jgi/Undpi1/1260/HiC_scaffold_109.g14174.m1